LDTETSSALRNLSRRSLIADIQLSQDEANLLAQTICKNMNENHYVSSWENIILLTSGQLKDGNVECQIESGMTLTAQNDQSTHIAVTYVLTFNLSEAMTYPFEFTLQSQPSATDTSLAQHAQMHPIDITAKSTESQTIYWSPWWVIEGELTLSLEEQVESKPSFVGQIVQAFISYPVLFLPILGLLAGGVLVFIRTKNSIGLDLEFEVKDEGDENQENENPEHHVDEDQEEEESGSDSTDGSEEDAHVDTLEADESVETVPARRKAKVTGRENTGSAANVKRKRLDSSLTDPVPVRKRKTTSKRKVVTTPKVEDVVKTRRVVTYSKDVEEDE